MKKKEKGMWIFLGIILLFCLVGFVMTSASTFIVAMIVSGIIYVIGNAEDRKMLREGKERKRGTVVANLDWNHPKNSVVIIDIVKGKVQFAQEG